MKTRWSETWLSGLALSKRWPCWYRNLAGAIAGLSLTIAIPLSALAQVDVETEDRPNNGIQAGLDAYRLGEERRQAVVRQQVEISDATRFWGGVPTSRGEVLYKRYTTPIYGPGYQVRSGYYRPYSNSAYSGYGYYGGGYGYSGFGSTWGGFDPYWGDRYSYSQTVVRPIIGYQNYDVPADPIGAFYSNPVRQPIGQRQVQTGENRWESYPIYSPEISSEDNGLTPVNSPLLKNTPYAPKSKVAKPVSPPYAPDYVPEEEDLPAPPPAKSGPREF